MPEFTNNTEEMLDPNIISQHLRMVNQTWRHKMKIAPFLKAENSFENTFAMCRYIVGRLNRIIEVEQRWQDKVEGETAYYVNKLVGLRDEFDYHSTRDATKVGLDELIEEVDDQLTELYDLADTKIRLKTGLQKFLWVGAM